MRSEHVVVVGAGIGGLSAAIELARQGKSVTVVERAATPGGKMRELMVAKMPVDSGPTVLTMRFVFDELFAACGADFGTELGLKPLSILARHAWSGAERFDLHADLARTTDEIGAFAGRAEAARFEQFGRDARAIYRTLKDTFLTDHRPNPVTLAHRIGLHRPAALFGIKPFDTLWSALGSYFRDPRLRQLFARYTTYAGSSPFRAPATLMLIAHVEQEGVWTVDGGMQRLADAMTALAVRQGCTIRYSAPVARIDVRNGRALGVTLESGERIEADAVVANADAAALSAGLFGADAASALGATHARDRSLSAITWSIAAETEGFPLDRHNVFFGGDYAAEFDALSGRRRLPEDPTIYVCAQDRANGSKPAGAERILVLINAPATGDTHDFSREAAECRTNVFARLAQCGLKIRPTAEAIATTPNDFHRMFPGTGGALYGRATHGWMASFQRPQARTAIPGLYLAGGSTHPGAGVPMAALSGRLAAQRLIADRPSTHPYRRAVISGGTSTH